MHTGSIVRFTGDNKSIAIIGEDVTGCEFAIFDAAVIAGLSEQLRVTFDWDGRVVSNVASLGCWATPWRQRHGVAAYIPDGLTPAEEWTTA